MNAETHHVEGCLNGATQAEMDGEEASEHVGSSRQLLQRTPPQTVVAIHQEQNPRHSLRPPDDPPVGALISRQIARRKRAGQGRRLAKCQGEAFAGYRVDGTGGVADENDPILRDRAQSA